MMPKTSNENKTNWTKKMMERCTSSDSIEIASDSRAEKTYLISFKTLLPTCTCISYKINRNKAKSNKPTVGKKGSKPAVAWCKHVEKAIDEGVCRWRGPTPLLPGLCPECGGPTEQCEDAFEMF